MPDMSMRRITEVRTGARPGFQVRFYGDVKDKAWFSTKKLGREVALQQAKRWRNKRERELGLTSKDYGSGRPRTRHAKSKSVPGVFVSAGKRNGRPYADVVAVLNYKEEGKSKRKQKAFSIIKYGYHLAFVYAVEARYNMIGLERPLIVEVPELDFDTQRKIVAMGASKKDLQLAAVIPWTGEYTTTKKI